ncbi:glutamyl aminopeptidase [Alicyclobacillus hesperidum URH17-3-68]|uniref:Aminopeptidase YsdC n=1 Tax=Alicyclobacillus hesperidum TaxID=89784 RepID=A0A1H2RJM2_9BACL|nr:M42 family metallopeptidase [Alicyclobacillus hesperidum]KRW92499.1 peptidase M28 [Alicyclobacillus tengchongensis]EJY55227.1 glutamyl aminopeptidase [Alicyclobacillus hesperidum URH17-3-68]SDW19448.1 endoglucanase [Alicyclobacillus hesperidum]GLG00101.1 putative aminopeptidase YsdC [Alicyclobacillus hesperidum subsp. aegles]GLV13595.1 putative aminopeptidase YsdC [Alicyclobacillus hesperidum]
MATHIDVLRELCDAYGISGYESGVRKLFEQHLAPLSEQVLRDRSGGIVGVKTGDATGPKVLVAGHLDEIGFMVTHITPEGFLKFQTIGGWWSQVVLSQRVIVQTRKGNLLGVTGSKPPHILPAEERKKVVELKDVFIDIGATSKEHAEELGVRPGDAIVPYSPFTQMGNPKMYMSKALDNRLGCATAIGVLKELQGQSHPNTLYAGATVQEEVGLRGARTLAHLVNPDIAISVDVGIAGDTPGIDGDQRGQLADAGKGPLLMIYDGSMIPNNRFRDFVLDTAATEKIPVQVESMSGGGTDAGAFHLHGIGVPSVNIGFATRYIHSHNAIVHEDDYFQAIQLITALVKALDKSVVKEIQEW